ncbi:DNA sulfur modification protein DndE [Enterobacter ludwigii]|uniref:DNA sulfur modification protein DndE n=1 Tax=Enterobacter TaxID=547 RepID=UPI000917F4C0|nr:DNA sulfur modification protein DndE [Enterobacter ludwigii]ELP5694331.1 DNA sulfur modification protein DndE [Enterobacter ludwigii]EMD2745582.1 DNA sulfur modification protein DndE [Enterobacter ludwigii]EMD2747083.1 DNA sulfur modification protein DndE [Enterobacter ludwigii]MDZ5702876.1 DNA sulfur modification protein DndE [Enterobacter ludwigii]SHM73947.1 DNA sulfur modification protein DndE [Enterobacter ludwigii]
MLPNRMQLSRQTEEQLKKLKGYTGLTPNISARLAFFRSIENGYRYTFQKQDIKLDGNLILDKLTWLGETMHITELTLKYLYPTYSTKDLLKAWAAHVEDGISAVRNYKSLNEFCRAL